MPPTSTTSETENIYIITYRRNGKLVNIGRTNVANIKVRVEQLNQACGKKDSGEPIWEVRCESLDKATKEREESRLVSLIDSEGYDELELTKDGDWVLPDSTAGNKRKIKNEDRSWELENLKDWWITKKSECIYIQKMEGGMQN
ncbi:hypothetical protein GMOD_00003971 [Pyrenophora seminiperda CCB06]|uniref:Uncharacterized protein n=1 Tax=Pyrenophora seminiperda CCB06 TaxID=1302712 RepID=A0A3M7M0H0_9PLEO|nr:hypothetical protein GMOD_00003971 [Pyrenophora seminiperda CCB06]